MTDMHFDDTDTSDAFAEVHAEVGTPSLDAAVVELASARKVLADTKARRDEAYARWEAENATLLKYLDDARTDVAEAERAVRTAGMAAYQQSNGDKHPHAAVNIRVNKLVRYQDAAARAWALNSAPTLLKLDTVAFDKVARTGIVPTDVVQIEEVPQVTIASDLSAYIVDDESEA